MKLTINWVYEANRVIAVHTLDGKIAWLQQGDTFTVLGRHKVHTTQPPVNTSWHIVLCDLGVVTMRDNWWDDDRVKRIR